MNMENKRPEVLSLLKAEFERERASGFALLRQVPSTGVRRFLDYFSSLDELGKEALADALNDCAILTFFPDGRKNPYQKGNIAYKRYVDAQHQIAGYRYENVNSLIGALALSKQSSNPWIPDDIAKKIEAIRPVKSSEIRKVVKLALSQIMAQLKVTHEPYGYWKYEGYLDQRFVVARIDYGQKHRQLVYGIGHSYQSQEPGVLRVDLSYEKLMGLVAADWDCLEQANLDQSIGLLKDLIARCQNFLQSLPSPDFKANP